MAPKNLAWQAPDWYIQSVSGGMGPLGVIKGFDELDSKWVGLKSTLDWDHSKRRLFSDGYSLEREQGDCCANPIAATRIETLATGDPGRTYTLLRQKMLSASGGTFESVTDEEAFRAMHLLAKMEGLSIEPAAAVAFAGVIKMVRSWNNQTRAHRRHQLHRSFYAGRTQHTGR
jgi:threonine synthase